MHPPPAVSDGVGGAPSHAAAAHEMRRGDGQHAGPEVAGGDALFETAGVGGLEEGRIGRRMHAAGSGGEEDACGRAGPPHQAVDGLRREAVVHDWAPRATHRDAIARGRVIARQDQDHLESRERVHDGTVCRAEARQALRRDERKVHAGFEHEALRRGVVDEVALRVPHIVRDRVRMLGDEDQRRVTSEAVAEGAGSGERGAQQQGRSTDGSRGGHDDPSSHLVVARRPLGRRAFGAGGLLADVDREGSIRFDA